MPNMFQSSPTAEGGRDGSGGEPILSVPWSVVSILAHR